MRVFAFVRAERSLRPRVGLFAPLRDNLTSSAQLLAPFRSAQLRSSLSILTEPHDELTSSSLFAERTLWNVRRGPALLRLDVGRPDDRPPLIDLRLVVGIERLRRLLFARRKLHADVSEAPLRGGVGEGGRDRGV